jgi:platelet-activating factor acetylhydrolase IB subunit beta/gamma
VITLGDSIMEGWSNERLGKIFGTTVLNSGFGQDGTEHVLWRLLTTDWHRQSPHRVLVLVGTNDLKSTSCEIYWGIRVVVAKVHDNFPMAHVIVTSIFPRGANLMESDGKIRAVNAALRAGADMGHFEFFETHDAFVCNHHTPCPLFESERNLHLTEVGYNLLDDLLERLLSRGSAASDF